MATKTIGLREDAYERLKARKRDDESFTDTIERLLDEVTADWRDGFGRLDTDEMEELEAVVDSSRAGLAEGLATRQQEALDALAESEEESDETP